ncbi:nst1, partial [Ophiophagus hannah]
MSLNPDDYESRPTQAKLLACPGTIARSLFRQDGTGACYWASVGQIPEPEAFQLMRHLSENSLLELELEEEMKRREGGKERKGRRDEGEGREGKEERKGRKGEEMKGREEDMKRREGKGKEEDDRRRRMEMRRRETRGKRIGEGEGRQGGRGGGQGKEEEKRRGE